MTAEDEVVFKIFDQQLRNLPTQKLLAIYDSPTDGWILMALTFLALLDFNFVEFSYIF